MKKLKEATVAGRFSRRQKTPNIVCTIIVIDSVTDWRFQFTRPGKIEILGGRRPARVTELILIGTFDISNINKKPYKLEKVSIIIIVLLRCVCEDAECRIREKWP